MTGQPGDWIPMTDEQVAHMRETAESIGALPLPIVLSVFDNLQRTRAELRRLEGVRDAAVEALRECNWSLFGLPSCITDALDHKPLTFEDERSNGERDTYNAIRALIAASTQADAVQGGEVGGA